MYQTLWSVLGTSVCIVPTLLATKPCLAEATRAHPTIEEQARVPHDCATVTECMDALRAVRTINLSAALERRFAALGEAALEQLIKMLATDPDPFMRNKAGQALTQISRIDPKYIPTLIELDKRGAPVGWGFTQLGQGGWLAIPIGSVRNNDDVLTYLFDLASQKGQSASTNGIRPAITRSSRELYLRHARKRLEAFSPSDTDEYYSFLVWLAHGADFRPSANDAPEWLAPALGRIAMDEHFSARIRQRAVDDLHVFRHPIALAAMLDRLRASLKSLPAREEQSLVMHAVKNDEDLYRLNDDSDFYFAISRLAKFGGAAVEAGPMIASFLSRPDMPDSRAVAALALGQIGYRPAIPDLIIAARDQDDWALAYHAVEALAMLRAAEARDILGMLASSHWSLAVRNNAVRALNMLNGGKFERPGVRRDAEPFETWEDTGGIYIGWLRYRGDFDPAWANCNIISEAGQLLPQAPVGTITFPSNDMEPLRIGRGASAHIPYLRPSLREQIPGRGVTTFEKLPHGLLIGMNGGEFGGGLVYIDRRRRQVVRVVSENMNLMFRMGGRLYAVTGMSHLGMSHGEIWEIDDRSIPARAVRHIRLPTQAMLLYATPDRQLAFTTNEGGVLLSEDGTLLALTTAPCTRE